MAWPVELRIHAAGQRAGSGIALRQLLRDPRGLTTIEYAIALCLIAALCVGAWSRFGGELATYIGRARVTIRDHLHEGKKGAQP